MMTNPDKRSYEFPKLKKKKEDKDKEGREEGAEREKQSKRGLCLKTQKNF